MHGLSLHVNCLSGCLTTSYVEIEGADSTCPNDGSIMARFLTVVCVLTVLSLLAMLTQRFIWKHSGGGLVGAEVEGSVSLCVSISSYCCKSVHSLGHAWRFIVHGSNAVVVIAFVKLVLAVLLSLFVLDWWKYGTRDGGYIVESCSNTTPGDCSSFCLNDTQTVKVGVVSLCN